MGTTEGEGESSLTMEEGNLIIKNGLINRRSSPAVYLKKLRAQLEALMRIQTEPVVRALLSLLVNDRGWLNIPHCR
jgi:hypothetical protein